jgi:arylsulfatase A-like enzyme
VNSSLWTRRRGLFAVLALIAVVVPQFAAAAPQRDGRPDIVVIMVDDLGAIDERVLERLPNIRDLFLENGLRFNSAYSETPLCCPGRASFLTGLHTRTHGVTANRASMLNPSRTVATALQDAGYYTIMAGKYLNYPDAMADKSPDGWDKVAILRTWLGNVWSSWWVQDRAETHGYHDRFLHNRALRWLERAPSNQPVFMWLASRAPHWAQSTNDGPVQGRLHPWRADVEQRYMNDSRCDGIEPWKPANYAWSKQPNGFPLARICRSLLTVDHMVGELREEMARQGRRPVYMFTSDNGMAWGVDGYPLKNVPQAGRLPVYFAGRGVVEGSTDALVSNIDFGPTLADLGHARMPWADGRSFSGLLRGNGGGREWMLEDHPRGGYTGKGSSGPWWGIRTPDWHLVEWNGTKLYNLRQDPLETTDVSATHLGEVADLMNLRPTLKSP